jgi:hypothetical protein
MVVQEHAVRVKPSTDLDERLGPGIATAELFRGEEVQLAPVHARTELAAKQRIDAA